MPYTPYWFESFALAFPWVIPSIALLALWFARCSDDRYFRTIAERSFFAAMIVVAWGTLRTVLANEGCWIVHMVSLAAMIVGSVFPYSDQNQEQHPTLDVADIT